MGKNKSKTKKPRSLSIEFDAPPAGVTALHLDTQTGAIYFMDEEKKIPLSNMQTTSSYPRNKNLKILTQIKPSGNNYGLLLNDLAALATYEWVFFIDTNCLKVDSKDVRISCFLGLQIRELDTHFTLDGHPETNYFEFVNIHCGNPNEVAEKLGWKTLIEEDFFRRMLAENKKIAVLVDAYLGDLTNFNSRIKPLLDNYYLPENVTLLYATADAKDSIPNQILKFIDAEANRVKGDIISGIAVEYLDGTKIGCESFRRFSRPGLEFGFKSVPKGPLQIDPNTVVSLYGIKSNETDS